MKEIFDLTDNLTRRINAVDSLRILQRQVQETLNSCGSCKLWMTRQCPREVHDNRMGRKHGPSCNSIKCEFFFINPMDLKRAQNDQDKIEAIKQLLMEIQ